MEDIHVKACFTALIDMAVRMSCILLQFETVLSKKPCSSATSHQILVKPRTSKKFLSLHNG